MRDLRQLFSGYWKDRHIHRLMVTTQAADVRRSGLSGETAISIEASTELGFG